MNIAITGWRGPKGAQLEDHHVAVLRDVWAQFPLDPDSDKLFVGDAEGVDQWWRHAAKSAGVPGRMFRAKWTKLGKAAGPERNGRMLAAAGPGTLVLAFPHPSSKGTWDCVKQAVAMGLEVHIHPLESAE